MRGVDGAELGTVHDIYRVGETEVFIVDGGPFGEFDVPAVRAFIRIFAPRRGEIVVDAESLDLRPRAIARPGSRPAEGAAPADRGAGARRRRAESPTAPTAPAADGRRRARAPTHDPRDRRPHALPGDDRRARSPQSIPGRIQEQGLAAIRIHDLREWGLGRHRSVDDAPYGGGAGMVLRPEPVAAALDALRRPDSMAILLDPVGEVFRQARAADLATRSHLVFVCPRYEGVDERIRSLVDLELSIGDYVLTGGELPALVVIDAVIRLLPGAIDDASTVEESFSDGLLEYPQYTRPAVFRGHGRAGDPDVGRPRRRRALARTSRRSSGRGDRRPDLARRRTDASAEERAILRRRRSPRPFRTPTRSLGCPD